MSPRLKTGTHSQSASGTHPRLTSGVARPASPQLANASQIRSRGTGENFFPFVRSMWDDTSWSSRTVAGWARKTMPAKKSLRRTPLRSRRWQRVEKPSVVESELRAGLALAFHDAAQKPWCAVCHEPRTAPLHAHHLIEASFLRREFKNVVDPLRMMAIQFDTRNQIGLCPTCHANHHAGMKSPVLRSHVPGSAWEVAREWDQFSATEKFTVRLEMYREAA